MGERSLAQVPRGGGWLAGRDLFAWSALLALLAIAVVLAWGFVPPPTRGADDPFAGGDSLAGFAQLPVSPGSSLLAAIALGVAGLLAAWRLEPALGPAAPWWVVVWVGVSAIAAALFWTPAAVILLAAAMLAWGLLVGDGALPREAPEVWAAEPSALARLARFLVAGALLGLVAAAHPVHLVMLGAAVLCIEGLGSIGGMGGIRGGAGTRRGLARGALVAGAAAVLGMRVALGGLDSWLAGITIPVFDLKLLGWNALYLLAGRNTGLLLLFPAVLLLAFGAGRDRPRRLLLAACALELLLLLLLLPFDHPGLPGAIGNRTFLPLYGALLCALGRPVERAPALVVAALGAVLLWPLLSEPRAHPIAENGQARWTSGLVQGYLPYETTLRGVPGAEGAVQGVRLRALNDAVWAAGSGGSFRLMGDARGEILLIARAPLGSLLAEFARDAPPRLEVEGGELGEMILRPDGGVAFEVLLGKPRAVHPTHWSADPQYFYALRLRLPDAPPKPIAFGLAPQRKPGGGS